MFVDGTLQVFTTANSSLQLVVTVNGFNEPAEEVVSGDGRTIYVNDWGTGTLKVVDACTLKITSVIPTGSLAITSYIPAKAGRFDGRYLYVASVTNLGISVIDTTTNSIVNQYAVPGIVGSHLSPDGKRLYAITALGVVVLDPQTGRQIGPTLLTGLLVPTWSTTSLDGSKLYLADTAGDGITIVNTSTMRIIKTIKLPFGTSPIVAKVTPDGSEVWVANGASANGIAIVSTKTDTLVTTMATNGWRPT
jgi:YVTN family beta-propeller protein